jgi:hypothetical protein
MLLQLVRRANRRLAVAHVAGAQRARAIPQNDAQLAEHGIGQAGDAEHGVRGEYERVDRQGHPTPNHHVEQTHFRRRGQRRHQEPGDGGLGHQQLAADLGQPVSDRPYEQVGQHDPQHHPRHELDGSLPALAERRAQ